MLTRDVIDAGGYSRPNQPHSIVIYEGLHAEGAGWTQPVWKYVNVAMHELGHALFGFQHVNSGPNRGNYYDPNSIMDYRMSYKYGANFGLQDQKIIKNSIWGQ